MARDRRPPARPATVPTADPTLRASIFRATARDPRTLGHLLARLRAARRQSPAGQAAGLGVSESALAYASLCRLPRPGRRDEDLVAVAGLVGIGVGVLERVVADAEGCGGVVGSAQAGGAA